MDIYAAITPIAILILGAWSLFSAGYIFDLRSGKAPRTVRIVERRRRTTDHTRPLPAAR